MYPQQRTNVTEHRLSVEELFVAHAAFVAGFAHRLGVRRAEVDDVVQEVFMVAHRKGGFVEGPARPRTWLGAIALRVCRSRRRSAARRREDYDGVALQHAESQGQSPAHAAEVAESLANVQRALDVLDVEHRCVFVLYEIEGETCSAIADALEIPLGTVYSRLHYARERFVEVYRSVSASTQPSVELSHAVRPT